MTRVLPGEIADASRIDNLDRIGRFSSRATLTPSGAFIDIDQDWDNSVVEGVWHLSGLWCYIWARVHLLTVDPIANFSVSFELPWQPDTGLLNLTLGTAGEASLMGAGFARDESASANSRVVVGGLINVTGFSNEFHLSIGGFLDGNNDWWDGNGEPPFDFDGADDRFNLFAEYPVDPNELAGVH